VFFVFTSMLLFAFSAKLDPAVAADERLLWGGKMAGRARTAEGLANRNRSGILEAIAVELEDLGLSEEEENNGLQNGCWLLALFRCLPQ
jgi:hypothetical protein